MTPGSRAGQRSVKAGWLATGLLLVATAAAGSAGQEAATARPSQAQEQPTAVRDARQALSAGDLDRAARLAEGHVRTHPRSAAARIVLAQVAMARDDPDAAFGYLHRALQDSPRDVDVLYHLGIVAGQLAGQELERLMQVAPDSARVHQVVAESLVLQGRQHEAAAAYEAALAREPDLFEALLGLARLRRMALQCDDAIRLYERSERLRPTYDGAYGLGVCLQYEQHDARALAAFEAATTRDPQSALAWQGLGISHMKLGRPEQAIVHLQRAIELQPRLYEAYYALGQAHRAAGDPERAKQAFDKAQQLQQGGGASVPPPARTP